MKRILNASVRSLFALALVSACAAVVGAQTRDVRVISARAGGVNFVSGDVSVRSERGKSWLRLSTSDELKSGDVVRTGADGRVEILLNPGSYFRAGADTQFTLADASLEDLRVGLSRGSAVLEATGYADSDLLITVATPRGLVRVVRSGVYRIDVGPSGVAEVTVLKGHALVGATLVKGGKVAREGGAGLEVAKLDKKERDALDLWSLERGKELARANSALSRRGVYDTLASAGSGNIFAGFSRHGYGGLWVWNSQARCFTFLPFYTNDWRSPYGYWYGMGAYFYPDPQNNQSTGAYTPPIHNRGGSPGSADGGKPMPPREVGPPRDMTHRQMPPREMPPQREMNHPAPAPPPAPASMPARDRAIEGLPQRHQP